MAYSPHILFLTSLGLSSMQSARAYDEELRKLEVAKAAQETQKVISEMERDMASAPPLFYDLTEEDKDIFEKFAFDETD